MPKFQVSSPVANFTGEIGGVGFYQGVGIATNENVAALAYFRRKGYTIEEITVELVGDKKPRAEGEKEKDSELPPPDGDKTEAKTPSPKDKTPEVKDGKTK